LDYVSSDILNTKLSIS